MQPIIPILPLQHCLNVLFQKKNAHFDELIIDGNQGFEPRDL